VHFVKKARKDNPVVKAGEPYYWWKPMYSGRGGPKRYSKYQPKRAQLASGFLAEFYSLVDDLPNEMDDSELDDLKSSVEEMRSTCEDSLSNMPESLQSGPTGELLQERVDGLQEWLDALENIDTSLLDDSWEAEDAVLRKEDEEDEAYQERLDEAIEEHEEGQRAAREGISEEARDAAPDW
jgi:soluble cytochrome b562